MSFVRSIEDVTPPARHDEDPWTTALFQEAVESDGTWTTIEEFEIEEYEAAEPPTLTFTTDAATQEPAWYRIVWEDASGDTATTRPEYWPELPAWGPSVADVSAVIRARTKVKGGRDTGVFNSKTHPTAVQVEKLIRQACRRVSTKIGRNPCTDDLRMDAGSAAALYTAMLVEQSYYPEQTTREGSSFKSLQSLWKDAIGALEEAVEDQCGEGDGSTAGGPMPAGSFDDGHGIISRGNPEAW
jgi:hypothetical protein